MKHRKIIAAFVAAAMIVTCLPVNAAAENEIIWDLSQPQADADRPFEYEDYETTIPETEPVETSEYWEEPYETTLPSLEPPETTIPALEPPETTLPSPEPPETTLPSPEPPVESTGDDEWEEPYETTIPVTEPEEEETKLIEREIPVVQDNIVWGDTETNGNIRIMLYNIFSDLSTTNGNYDPDISAVDPSCFKLVRKAVVSFTIDGIDEALGSGAEFTARMAYIGGGWLAMDFDTTVQITGDGKYSISTNFEPLIDEETGMPVPAEDSGLNLLCIDILDLAKQLGLDYETYNSGVNISDVSVVLTMPALSEFEYSLDGQLTAYNGFGKDVVIPDEIDGIPIVSIASNAFNNCSYIETITIPAGIEQIKSNPFGSCTSLKAINVSKENTHYSSIDGVLFADEGKTLLSFPPSYPADTYEVPETVTKIEPNAFSNGRTVKTLVLPDGIDEIGSSTFYMFHSLEKVNIPDGVTVIGDFAFYECSLTEINIPDSVTVIKDYAFYSCPLTEINIPDSVTEIGDHAFSCCSLTEVNIPDSVTVMNESAFLGCSYLINFNVDKNNKNYKDVDGVLLTKDGTKLIKYPEGREETACVIPDGVKIVGEFAFYGCDLLYKITIPESVEEIDAELYTFMLIYGHRGSYAETYANENDFMFIDPDFAIYDDYTGVMISALDWKLPQGAVLNVEESINSIYFENYYSINITVNGKNYPFEGQTEVYIPMINWGGNIKTNATDIEGNELTFTQKNLNSVTFFLFTTDHVNLYVLSPEKSVSQYSLFAGLTFQTNTYSFRDNINQSTGYYWNEYDELAEYPNWSVNDAEIIGNGTYTISFERDLTEGGLTESAWNVLKLQTNVSPYDQPDFNITVDSLKIDGREIESAKNATLITDSLYIDDYSDVLGYLPYGVYQMDVYSLVLFNVWSNEESIQADDFGEKVELTFTVSGMAKSVAYGTLQYEETEDGNICITKYFGNETDVVIPSQINGKKVTVIGEHAFDANETMTHVTIPDTVVEIGADAFARCALESVTIPESVTTIGMYAFYDCISLKSVTTYNGLVSIGEYAFDYCTKLESIYIPASVETIGENAFMECYSLTEFDVDENNKYYKDVDGVLFNKDGTTLLQFPISKGGDYTVPDGVVTIAENAFENNFYVTSVTMPDSVREMGPRAFFACVALKTVNLSKNITEISDAAFMFCPYLESAVIPEGVTTIGDSAFGYCYALKSAYIPESVTIIKDSAYTACDSLTEITIPDNVKEIGMNAFSHCTNLTSVTLSNNITKLNDYIFYNCMKLEKVVIPANVVDFGEYIFGVEIYDDDNNVIDYEYPEKLTLYGYADSPAQDYANKNSLKFIVIGSTITDEKSDIAVSGSDNTVPEDAVLIVEQTKSDDSTISYDITLTSDGEEIQPEGEVTVRIPVPDGWSGEEIHVYHKDENGRLTDMNAVVSGGYIIFTTDHFSEYIITTEKQDTTILGDVNGDGIVNELDSVALARYFAQWDVTIDEKAADLDGDGSVTELDSVILARRLAGWNV